MTPDDEPLPPGGVPIDDLAWEPWEPAQLAAMLGEVTAPWYVAGGWAIDLFRGHQTREHEDLEIGIPNTADAFGQFRQALPGFDFEVPGGPPPGRLWPLDSPAFSSMYQTWVSEVRQPEAGAQLQRIYRLDIFREPQRDGLWVCRRDESIALPYDEIIRHDDNGIPYLAPYIALLFKAKDVRSKDQADLAGTLPLLAPEDRAWLTASLSRIHPGHEWLTQL